MLFRIPFCLLLLVPATTISTVFFESDFECGRTYTAAAIKPGAKEIELLPCANLSHWPLDGGKGVIESNYPDALELFQYVAREDRILKGITGLKKRHAKWVDIRTGGFNEWNIGKNLGTNNAGDRISVDSKNPLAGAFSANFDCGTKETAILVHAFKELADKELYCRFLARFDAELLGHEVHAIPFFYLNMKSLTTPRLVPIKQGKGKPTHLVFQEPHGGTMISRELKEDAPVVLPNKAYLLEVSFQRVAPNRLVSRLWVNGKTAAQAVTEHVLYKQGGPAIMLGKAKPLRLKGAMKFDEITLANSRLGAFPPKPQIIFRDGRLQNHPLQEPPWAVNPIVASHWQVSADNSWLTPLLNTGPDSSLLRQLPHPQVLQLPDSLNPLFVSDEPIFAHTGAKPGTECFARIRQCAPNGNWSEWSNSCRFTVPSQGPDPKTPYPRIRSVWFTRPEENEPMSGIMRGKWYDLHVGFIPSGKETDFAGSVINVAFSADTRDQMGYYHGCEIAFRARSNYFFSITLPRAFPYVREKEGSTQYSQAIGLKGLYCDPTGSNYQIDLKNGLIRVRVRLLEQALPGAWEISAVMLEPGESASPIFRDLLLVSDRERLADEPTKGLRVLMLASLPVLLVLAAIWAASRHGLPGKTQRSSLMDDIAQSKDRRIRTAYEFIQGNFTKPISPKDVARAINVSPNWLSKLFKQNTKANVSDFIAALRIREAERLLKETNLDEEEIAHKTGFSSLVNFRRVFKKSKRKTPYSFRNSV